MIECRRFLWALCLLPAIAAILPMPAWAQQATQRITFHVKYLAEGVVYLDGGSAAGLREGEELIVKHAVAKPSAESQISLPPPSNVVATLQVLSVAASSAVCRIVSSTDSVNVGDEAQLSPEVVQREQQEKQEERLTGGREYPQLITFTGADPVVQEARDSLPRPPSPDIDRMRGMMGVEYSTIFTHGNPSSASSEVGMVARMDMTRIAGTYWNFNGYWRGRFTTLSGSAAPATISDLINRTYTLSLQYNNPDSRFVAGGGRLYLPWATSLDTIDGGYAGVRTGDHVLLGVFAGTTPDPTSYDYNPNQKLAGGFMNFSGGSFEDWRYSATFGLALNAIGWHATRQFGFVETTVSFKHAFSFYDATEIDAPHTAVLTPPSGAGSSGTGTAATTSTGGLNRSYVTVRFQPDRHIEFSLNDTYYRDFPSFDPQLIATGLLDRYLFQGLSGGVRVSLPAQVTIYTDLGKSSAAQDATGSWNQLYGITFGRLWKTGMHADARYSRFNSAFGSGDYKAISLSGSVTDRLQWQLIGGLQNFFSTVTTTSATHFLTTSMNWSPGKLLFLEVDYTWQRGGTMNYDQFEFIVGKRFGGSLR